MCRWVVLMFVCLFSGAFSGSDRLGADAAHTKRPGVVDRGWVAVGQ